jgi:starvation-inducible DNA-binding protein
MNELTEALKKALADTFAFYLKAHNFHWNVEGPNFNDYHAFFGALYADAWGAVDTIAEHIRTLDSYAPGSFSRYSELSRIKDEVNIPSAMSMMTKLEADNRIVIETLTTAMKAADKTGKANISNFLQDRIDAHEKHGWQLRSITKS